MTVDTLVSNPHRSRNGGAHHGFLAYQRGRDGMAIGRTARLFLYRDLGVAAATNGRVIAQLVKPTCRRKRARAGTATRPNFISSLC